MYQIKSIKLWRQKGDKFHLIAWCTLIDSTRKCIIMAFLLSHTFLLSFSFKLFMSLTLLQPQLVMMEQSYALGSVLQLQPKNLSPAFYFLFVRLIYSIPCSFFALTSSSLCLNPIYVVIFTRQLYSYSLVFFLK